MRALLSKLGPNNKHTIDFSLVPLAIILIEFSVFITQLSSDSTSSPAELTLMRATHTLAMILISHLVSLLYIRLNRPALSYLTLALTAIFVLGLGDIIHALLASALGIELVSVSRRIGIILIQGSLWFPAIMIVLGYRREILAQFKDYLQQLVFETRLRIRTSSDIRLRRRSIRTEIEKELNALCGDLAVSIAEARNRSKTLAERNSAMRSILAREDLRRYSRRLYSFESKRTGRRYSANTGSSLRLLASQFQVLHSSALLRAPLGVWAYVAVLIALATPPFIYFHSFTELLFTLPSISLAVFLAAKLITRVQRIDSPLARATSSILTLLVGWLPAAADLAWQFISPNPQTQVPLLVTAVALPLTYFVFMEIFQVLRPKALGLIRNNQLEASKALNAEVTKTVIEEFSHHIYHQWAVYIHGKIITRLAATSLKLEEVASQEDDKAFNETVRTLNALLSDPGAGFEASKRDLESEVKHRLEPWSGLLVVDLSIDEDLKPLKNSRVRDLGEVIEELISNAIRHGKAKRIKLNLVRSGVHDLEVIAIDDSSSAPFEPKGKAGLGTSIFNLASDGRWSINRLDSTTEFRLTMGIES
jgi:two-component sensor histidine kinase